MDGDRPVIAITRGISGPRHIDLYCDAVVNSGGRAVTVSPGDEIDGIIDSCDGYIIPGGKDIAPEFYGETGIFSINAEEPERVGFELSLLSEIMVIRKPLLGICYGMQLINVFLKGSLYQDITSQVPGALDHSKGKHKINIMDNPWMEAGSHDVNSSHHQSVCRPGRGVIPCGVSADGIIEAFYLDGDFFVIGVQWHPERLDDLMSRSIFYRLIEASSGLR